MARIEHAFPTRTVALTPTMVCPYSTIEFGDSLRHIGEPLYVPEWGTTVLQRDCGTGHRDVIGTYPIAVLKPDCDVAGGLDRLARLGVVSAVLTLDDALRPQLADLRQAFDFVRPFKCHYLYDRRVSAPCYSKHHRHEIRRAMRAVTVARFDLADRLDEWVALYRMLVGRRGLDETSHALPRRHHRALAHLPGVAAVGAFIDGHLVSGHIWLRHDGHAVSHLAASNDAGYASGAAYAVNAAAIELLDDCQTLNFGGAAGAVDDLRSGLARFKRGFSNAVAPSYLCGKVLAADAYATLSRQAGTMRDTGYFPAYRGPSPPVRQGEAACTTN